MSRRSVDVTPSLADAEGRVHATIPFSPSQVTGAGALRGRNTVSVGELAIPDRARSEYDQAQKKLSRQDVPGATNHLKRAVELAPQYMAAWTELGTLAARGRNWVEAETYYRKALELRPGAVMLSLNLAGVLVYLRRYEEALGYNRFAVERSPNNALANAQLGMTYFLLERDDEALKYLKIAKDLDPAHYSHPQLALADIYLKRGDLGAATGEFEDFLVRHPDASNAHKVREEIARIKR